MKQMNSAITNELAPEVNNGLLRVHIVYNIDATHSDVVYRGIDGIFKFYVVRSY